MAYEEISSAATEDTQYTLAVVRDIARADRSLAQRLVDSGEIAGGVSGGELADPTGSDNYYLQLLAEENQDLAEIREGHQWSAREANRAALASPLYNDGLTRYQRWAMPHFPNIAVEDEGLAEDIARLHWVGDGITEDEQWALGSIRYIASEQSSQASRLVESPWVSDGIVTHEMRALGTIAVLLFTWSSWSVEDSGLAEALFDQGWFQDGLSKEEAAVVTVL